jgi:hypothetical protein
MYILLPFRGIKWIKLCKKVEDFLNNFEPHFFTFLS